MTSTSHQSMPLASFHPEGPNERALRAYLARQGFDVHPCRRVEEFLRRLEDDPATRGLVHRDAPGVREALARASFARVADHVLCICPTGAKGGAAEEPRVATIAEPYLLSEVADRLAALVRAAPRAVAGPAPVESAPDAGRDPEFAARLLGSIGRALGPHLSSADGWLQLLLQDIRPSDPAHRHISHARREMRELDRHLKLLRLADETSAPHIAPVSLPALVREVIRGVGVTSVPIAVELSEDLPEIAADPKLARLALECLLRGALEPAGRPESIAIRTREEAGGVELRIIEEGHRLDADQLGRLCAPGESLLYNSFGRGVGFPLAKRLFARQAVDMDVRSESGQRLAVCLRFRSIGTGLGSDRAGVRRVGDRPAEGAR
ncbi:MAG: hypothetical protein R3F20_04035 [Planctomycetota bacterium]